MDSLLLPLIIKKRKFIHVDDIFRLFKIQIIRFDKCDKGIFNLWGGIEISTPLFELTAMCQGIKEKKFKIHSVKENRVADVPIYISDISKIYSLSGWCPTKFPRDILTDIFYLIRKNDAEFKGILN